MKTAEVQKLHLLGMIHLVRSENFPNVLNELSLSKVEKHNSEILFLPQFCALLKHFCRNH